jgi:N-acetylmuramoyl-L-alanine amidase
MRRFWPLLIAIILGPALSATGASAQVPELRVASGDSERSFAGSSDQGYVAYPADAFSALGASVESIPGGIRALFLGDTLSFDLFSPIFHDAGKAYQLVAPVYRRGDKIYLPAQLFTEWLPTSRPERLSYGAGVLRLDAGQGKAPETAAKPTPKPTSKPTPEPPATAEPRVVIIDPGHGGRDPGMTGPGGIREKDLTLTIARRLAAVLTEMGGYEVHLTRTTDTLIDLADRPHMANRWKANRPAALFLSIHANSVSNREVRGFETFFLSDARTEDERRVAEMENAAVKYEEKAEVGAVDDLDWIFNTLRNDFYIRASNDLAEVIQQRLATFHPGPNRGVKQAGFRVLVGAFMPAALVEMAFVSNQQEAAMMKDAAFQRRMAIELATAVDHFFTEHEHLWTADPGTLTSR